MSCLVFIGLYAVTSSTCAVAYDHAQRQRSANTGFDLEEADALYSFTGVNNTRSRTASGDRDEESAETYTAEGEEVFPDQEHMKQRPRGRKKLHGESTAFVQERSTISFDHRGGIQNVFEQTGDAEAEGEKPAVLRRKSPPKPSINAFHEESTAFVQESTTISSGNHAGTQHVVAEAEGEKTAAEAKKPTARFDPLVAEYDATIQPAEGETKGIDPDWASYQACVRQPQQFLRPMVIERDPKTSKAPIHQRWGDFEERLFGANTEFLTTPETEGIDQVGSEYYNEEKYGLELDRGKRTVKCTGVVTPSQSGVDYLRQTKQEQQNVRKRFFEEAYLSPAFFDAASHADTHRAGTAGAGGKELLIKLWNNMKQVMQEMAGALIDSRDGAGGSNEKCRMFVEDIRLQGSPPPPTSTSTPGKAGEAQHTAGVPVATAQAAGKEEEDARPRKGRGGSYTGRARFVDTNLEMKGDLFLASDCDPHRPGTKYQIWDTNGWGLDLIEFFDPEKPANQANSLGEALFFRRYVRPYDDCDLLTEASTDIFSAAAPGNLVPLCVQTRSDTKAMNVLPAYGSKGGRLTILPHAGPHTDSAKSEETQFVYPQGGAAPEADHPKVLESSTGTGQLWSLEPLRAFWEGSDLTVYNLRTLFYWMFPSKFSPRSVAQQYVYALQKIYFPAFLHTDQDQKELGPVPKPLKEWPLGEDMKYAMNLRYSDLRKSCIHHSGDDTKQLKKCVEHGDGKFWYFNPKALWSVGDRRGMHTTTRRLVRAPQYLHPPLNRWERDAAKHLARAVAQNTRGSGPHEENLLHFHAMHQYHGYGCAVTDVADNGNAPGKKERRVAVRFYDRKWCPPEKDHTGRNPHPSKNPSKYVAYAEPMRTIDVAGYLRLGGPSGTSGDMMSFGQFIGGFDQHEMAILRLRLVAYFTSNGFHSFIEVLLGSDVGFEKYPDYQMATVLQKLHQNPAFVSLLDELASKEGQKAVNDAIAMVWQYYNSANGPPLLDRDPAELHKEARNIGTAEDTVVFTKEKSDELTLKAKEAHGKLKKVAEMVAEAFMPQLPPETPKWEGIETVVTDITEAEKGSGSSCC
ncbi:unnamed protein product [Amoebophrya sp. A25]|nr:unnamed protein product [Amoebophrya sp. A25]|eukprot:GSA25T00014470001.1